VDQPRLSDVLFPSVLRRGNFQVAVSTGGRSPALAREVRRRLEPLFPPSLATLLERAGAARARALARAPSRRARRAAAEAIARQLLDRLGRELRPAVV
jgi:precorrin-2 dehydrogenase/sirohydrochlorin ferrochelatase